MTDAAPWRFDVPTQSDPVSPPPITTTCLPVARIWSRDRVAGDDLVLLRQELHREMDAVEIAARHRQIARRFRAARDHDRIVVGEEVLGRDVVADVDARPERRRPRLDICAMRRSIRCFSILKSGMP